MNHDTLSAFIMPNNLINPKDLHLFLSTHFPHAFKRLPKYTHHAFMYVQRNITKKELSLIEHAQLSDIKILHEPGRFYPNNATAHIVGITDSDNKGIHGLELFYNEQLRGTPTTYHLEKDARSERFYFKETTQIQGKQGVPITTTLDSTLQFLTSQELKACLKKFDAQEGAALIVDPHTGEIITLVREPGFDPNDRRTLFLFTTITTPITQTYELGSVIKIFAALAALEEGVVTKDELIDCYNARTAYVNGRKVNTAPGTQAGLISFSQVIEKSNNIGIAKIAQRLEDRLYDHYIRLGFGKKTGIQFPSERKGFVNHPAHWSKQSVISLSYGYEISATLVQLAHALCIIARDGYDVDLTLIKSNTPTKKQVEQPLYSQKSINDIKEILKNTTIHGTARRAQVKGYTVMSKTGTANLLVDGNYCPTNNIYTCAGIIKKDDYQRVIITWIKEAKKPRLFASTVAAPLFEKIAEKTLIHDKIL